MYEHVVSHRGHSLSLFFQGRSFYAVTDYGLGKTLYQILFERFVDGKLISCRGFARAYSSENELLNNSQVRDMMQRIVRAARKSPDKAVRKMRFVTLPRGGASPVLLRKSTEARFSQRQNRVIAEAINALHADGKKHSYMEDRRAGLTALRRLDLAQNVILSKLKILKVRTALGLTKQRKLPKRKK